MRGNMKNRIRLTGAFLVISAAAVLMLAGGPVSAQQEEPSDMAKLFGYLGLIDLPKDPIDYRERAPLVVPPSVALVPPSDASRINQINPDWPVDHDERIRRSRKIDPKVQAADDDTFYGGRKLTPEEMRRGTTKKKQQAATKSENDFFSDPNKARMSPSDLGFKGWNSKEQEKPVVFAGEPDRGTLTEPPPGYRTPSPNAPFGVVTKAQERFKAPNYMDKGVADDPATRR